MVNFVSFFCQLLRQKSLMYIIWKSMATNFDTIFKCLRLSLIFLDFLLCSF